MPLDALVLRGVTAHSDWHSNMPLALISGTGDDPRPRLRVDPGETAFEEGRVFMLQHEFTISNAASLWLTFDVPSDVIVRSRTLNVSSGGVRLQVSVGGALSGSWTTLTPQHVNSMDSRPLPLVSPTPVPRFGGTAVLGTSRHIEYVGAGGGNPPSKDAVMPQFGAGPGVYNTELRNVGTGSATGVYTVVWEEVRPRSPLIY